MGKKLTVKARRFLLENYRTECYGCSKCSELSIKRMNVVFGDGKVNAKLMFIGEAPGKDEDEKGIPFVGSSGRVLSSILSEIGIDRKKCYITNIVKCRPPYNRIPTEREMRNCSVWLGKELEIVDPTVIVPLGATAMREVFYQLHIKHRGGITNNRGSVFQTDEGVSVVPTFHPSYVLRQQGVITLVKMDLKMAWSLR